MEKDQRCTAHSGSGDRIISGSGWPHQGRAFGTLATGDLVLDR
jgi:hypothetical protein